MAGKYYTEEIEVKSYAQVANSSGGFTAGTPTTKYSTTAVIYEKEQRIYNADGSTSFSSFFNVEFWSDPSAVVAVGDFITYAGNELVINQCRLDDRKSKYLIKATAKV